MTVLALQETPITAPISPELVLVSSPEVARFARSLLTAPPPRPSPARGPVELVAQPGQAELAIVWLVCIAMTLGPLLFLLVARP